MGGQTWGSVWPDASMPVVMGAAMSAVDRLSDGAICTEPIHVSVYWLATWHRRCLSM